jgi:EAL domain-containing protein (putative c-di-GMP-specific phosphodiesterase class I)
VVDELNRSRAGQRRISVEFTETAEIEDLQAVAETAARLRGVGVSVALDDFGTGTAGVDVLRAVEPDVVKIDGSFTSGITSSKRARAMLQGMIGVARSASDRIVAERIETEDEARMLLSMEVDEGQGWLFGRPKGLPLRAPGASREVGRAKEVREVWGR